MTGKTDTGKDVAAPKPIAMTNMNFKREGPDSLVVLYDDGTIWYYHLAVGSSEWCWKKLDQPGPAQDLNSNGSGTSS